MVTGVRDGGGRSKDMFCLMQLPGLLCLNVVALVAVGIGGGLMRQKNDGAWGSTAGTEWECDVGFIHGGA